jgi:hypothetical protein
VATIAPLSYTKMLWALIVGFVWFGEVPTALVLGGSAIVIAASALVDEAPEPSARLHRAGWGAARGIAYMPGNTLRIMHTNASQASV